MACLKLFQQDLTDEEAAEHEEKPHTVQHQGPGEGFVAGRHQDRTVAQQNKKDRKKAEQIKPEDAVVPWINAKKAHACVKKRKNTKKFRPGQDKNR